jgi:hypothetical protein
VSLMRMVITYMMWTINKEMVLWGALLTSPPQTLQKSRRLQLVDRQYGHAIWARTCPMRHEHAA